SQGTARGQRLRDRRDAGLSRSRDAVGPHGYGARAHVAAAGPGPQGRGALGPSLVVTDLKVDIGPVSKGYGGVVALRELTFDVRAGELFGFVGSNGAGKTTAMRAILGVLAIDGGEVRWAGQPLTLAVRRQIGYMPEERGLYPRMKVAEQLEYLAKLHGMNPAAARKSVDRWTERLGVAGRRGDEVQKLSLGNQQRVQLA